MTKLRYKILGRDRLKDLQPPSYLIPRILPEQGLVTLVAEPSSKKSFLAVHMASCVATGTPFFDIPTNKTNNIPKTLFIMMLLSAQKIIWKRCRNLWAME